MIKNENTTINENKKNVEVVNKPELARIVPIIIRKAGKFRMGRKTRKTMKNEAENPTRKTTKMETMSTQFHRSKKNGLWERQARGSMVRCASVILERKNQLSVRLNRTNVSKAKIVTKAD